jgi:hypothetical protein
LKADSVTEIHIPGNQAVTYKVPCLGMVSPCRLSF